MRSDISDPYEPTFSIALLTNGLVINPCRNRFSTSSLFELPELRHAIPWPLRETTERKKLRRGDSVAGIVFVVWR